MAIIGIPKSMISPEINIVSPSSGCSLSIDTTNESAKIGAEITGDRTVSTNNIPSMYLNILQNHNFVFNKYVGMILNEKSLENLKFLFFIIRQRD